MSNTPQIRFAGFTDAWEQRKLNKYLTVSTKKNTEDKYDKTDVLSVSGEVGVVNQIEFQGRSFAGASVSNYGVVETGDVVYTKSPLRANPYGIIKANKGKSGIVSTLYAVYKTIQGTANADFIECYFDLDDRLNMYLKPLVNIGAKHDMKVTDENALKGGVLFPSYEEQCQIADFFSRLDTLITLHQRECFSFDFSGESAKTAQKTISWEQRKVGELTVESSEYTTLEAGFPLLTSSRNGLMYQNEYRGKQTTDSTETMFSIVPLGACTYRHMSDDDVFHLNVNRLEKGLVSREYPVFYASDDNNLDFIVQQINSSAEFRSFCAEQKKGGTRTRLYYKNLCEFQMLIPNTEEQEKIATFLLTLDTLITLHQRKCDALQKFKKSMLQKMFPQNGESVPEIRFAGFTDAWEQRKFSELTEIRSASRVHKDEWQSSGVPFYRSSDVMAALNGTENEKAFISEELYEKLSAVSGKLEKGDVLVTGGGSVGKPYIVPNNEPLYTKDADLLWIKNNENLDPYFVYTFFFSPTFTDYLNSVSHVGTIAHYTITQLGETPITLPCVSEQQKIGDYFRNLDFLITLHQRKLETLQKMKKSLLQKMFV